MSNLKEDIERLRQTSVKLAPQVAILECIGCNGEFAEGHKPFVIKRKSGDFLKGVWDEGVVAEYETFDDALSHPSATPYRGSALCNACTDLASRKNKQ